MAPGSGCGPTNCGATTGSTGSAGIGNRRTARVCLPPLGGSETGPDPTNRGKLGTKRHILSDRRGAPLSVVISAANRHDMKLAAATLDGIVVARPTPTRRCPQHLCRDKGFDFAETRTAAEERGYAVHTPVKGLDTPPPAPDQRHPARRWVIERTNAWHNRFRKLRIRYEKDPKNYQGLVHLACALIVYRLRLVLG
jgi:putative transposase